MPTDYRKDYDPNWSSKDYNNIPKEDELNEIWRPIIIDGIDTGYMISNMGRCKSSKGNIIAPFQQTSGYIMFEIYSVNNNSRIVKKITAHRMVANAFLSNPDPKHFKEINHKDENKKNNRLDNLEYCTSKYNQNYGSKIQRQKETRQKIKKHKSTKPYPILQYSLEGCFIAEYPSQGKASKAVGIDQSRISSVFCGRNKTAAGFIWIKKDSDVVSEKIDPTPYLKENFAFKRIGEKRMMNCGVEAEIIEYDGKYNLTIEFEDGLKRYHIRMSAFKKGCVAHKADPEPEYEPA